MRKNLNVRKNQIFTGGYLNYSKSYLHVSVVNDGMRGYEKHRAVVNNVLLDGESSSALSFDIKCYLSARSGIDVERFNVVAIKKYLIDNYSINSLSAVHWFHIADISTNAYNALQSRVQDKFGDNCKIKTTGIDDLVVMIMRNPSLFMNIIFGNDLT